MKNIRNFLASLVLVLFSCGFAHAQYYEMANQLQRMISPALSGSFNYKGFVEASYVHGIDNKKSSFVEITTTQGFKYANWFFMGVGAGVEAVFTDPDSQFTDWDGVIGNFNRRKDTSKTGWIIPLYTDFRFNIGNPQSVGFFIDVRVGASFLVSDNYLEIGDGYLTSSECFYLRPSIGLRIPLSMTNSKQALNIGASYQLMTSRYWHYNHYDTTLNAFGVSIGFEW